MKTMKEPIINLKNRQEKMFIFSISKIKNQRVPIV
jgi:hypothetical protein